MFIFSPSINVDYQTWEPVKKYLGKEVNDGDKDDNFYFDYCKKNFSENITLINNYNLFDFTILVKK